jgi:2-dehydro-3-deoxyphosphogalactonate aldolase
MNWTEAFDELPLVAILRGVSSDEAVRVASVLFEAGFRLMEVPLNSPDPLDSIAKIRAELDGRVLVGAGTVLNRDAVVQASSAGAQFIVSPNTDSDVIGATKDLNLVSLPAFSTPTEALLAIKAGADVLKLFPAEANSPPVLRSIRAVLPTTIKILPVGGITPSNMQPYRDAGADGFGIGSALYRQGKFIDDIQASAASFITAWRGTES